MLSQRRVLLASPFLSAANSHSSIPKPRSNSNIPASKSSRLPSMSLRRTGQCRFRSFCASGIRTKDQRCRQQCCSLRTMGSFATVSDQEYLDGVTANAAMAWNVARAFVSRAAPDATAIDVNSNAAHVNYRDAFASYSVAKWASIRLWQLVQFNNPGLSVYSIQPGVVDTDMNRRVGGVKAMNYEDHGECLTVLNDICTGLNMC